MFLGQFEHSIDDKGRMTIPARFRELLEGGAFISAGFEHNLIVWPCAAFEKVYGRIHSMSVTNPSARLLRRQIFANAAQLEFDKAGRILIPQHLRLAGSLAGMAIVAGVGETFEIWAPELWNKEEVLFTDGEANAERFATLDLPLD